jgi:YbbR domain-containing protein
VNLIIEDWRLKLLAIGLAVLMLVAVAFSQNPPTSGYQTVLLSYPNVAPNIILLNPPTKAIVNYSGLADVIRNISPNNLIATVDASHAKPGSAVKLNVTARALDPRVIVQNPPPIAVDIESLQGKDLPVQVSARAAPGWSVTKQVAICPGTSKPNPCVVHFDGPATWETNLTAFVPYSAPVNVSTIDSPNQLIQLQNSNGALDLTSCRTVPCAQLDITSASVHIEAVAGSTSSTVPLVDSPPSHPPPAGYRVTAITITPLTVIITGDPAQLGRIQRIILAPVDLSGRTSDATFQVNISYDSGISGNVSTATVKYSISANPNVSPSP